MIPRFYHSYDSTTSSQVDTPLPHAVLYYKNTKRSGTKNRLSILLL